MACSIQLTRGALEITRSLRELFQGERAHAKKFLVHAQNTSATKMSKSGRRTRHFAQLNPLEIERDIETFLA